MSLSLLIDVYSCISCLAMHSWALAVPVLLAAIRQRK